MSRTLPHPTREQIGLPIVLDCLSDPIRLAIVYDLARADQAAELCCSDFYALSGKSNLAYHFAKLREAGLIQTRIAGTARLMSLRRADVDARFPGLLDAVLKSAARDAERLQLPMRGGQRWMSRSKLACRAEAREASKAGGPAWI